MNNKISFFAKFALITILVLNLSVAIDSSTLSIEVGISPTQAQLMGTNWKKEKGNIICNGVVTEVNVCLGGGNDTCEPDNCGDDEL